MKVIFGLGNPGSKYRNNRHNAGYMAADELIKSKAASFKISLKFNASLGRVKIGEENVLLVKPRTFMNNSGVCVKKVMSNYKIIVNNVLVVYDDVDLPLGAVRFKEKGSSAGHRGLSSIIEVLGEDKINRLRIGIGRKENMDLRDYVLSDFSCEEKTVLNEAVSKAALACLDWVNSGNEYVMRNYNKRS